MKEENIMPVSEALENCPINTSICNLIYPVGSVYISVNDLNPTNLFGGTWEQMKDRFLLGTGSKYNNNVTGGEATHTLITDEMPSHTHTCGNGKIVAAPIYSWEPGVDRLTFNNNIGYGVAYLDNAGGSKSHNNMPPYITVCMWKRTA